MMNVVAFRHAAADGLGSLEGAIEKAGGRYAYIDTYRGMHDGFDGCAPDLLIVLGGAPGVYQRQVYDFMQAEIDILKMRIERDLPCLGICLGAQMMAHALGADVYPGAAGQEKGWSPLTLTEAGKTSPVRHLEGGLTQMLHWHGDTFDLPDGAELLASSSMYKHQAFRYGKKMVGLQCHAEITPRQMQDWYVGSASAVARGKLDLEQLRRDTDRYAPTLMRQNEQFFTDYLADAGLGAGA